MKTELQKHLATLAPQISIHTLWETDSDAWNEWEGLSKAGNCMEGESPADWCAWQSSITASAVSLGELHIGTAYLGGTWEEVGDDPRQTNPEISGYELQMTEEAINEMAEQITDEAPLLRAQIAAALDYIHAESLRRYDEQRGSVVTA